MHRVCHMQLRGVALCAPDAMRCLPQLWGDLQTAHGGARLVGADRARNDECVVVADGLVRGRRAQLRALRRCVASRCPPRPGVRQPEEQALTKVYARRSDGDAAGDAVVVLEGVVGLLRKGVRQRVPPCASEHDSATRMWPVGYCGWQIVRAV